MLVSEPTTDQAVMLEKEPDNAYDPSATAIKTLSGASLGYVPRDLTSHFPHEVTFGHIHHVGQVPENGAWGALVRCLPFAYVCRDQCLKARRLDFRKAGCRRHDAGRFHSCDASACTTEVFCDMCADVAVCAAGRWQCGRSCRR